jgi:hypothetical protein
MRFRSALKLYYPNNLLSPPKLQGPLQHSNTQRPDDRGNWDKMTNIETFHIRVDEGPEQTIDVKTGIYRNAVAAIPAILGLELPINVEIWCPRLLSEYGPYFYRVEQNDFGGLVTKVMIRRVPLS